MANDAWADDPDLRVVEDDDPDSQKIKAFLRRWVWPGIGGLALVVSFAVMFGLDWAYDLLKAAGVLWLVGQLIVRPRRFIASVVGCFAKASGFMAGLGSPLIAWLNKRARGSKPKAQAQAFAASAVADAPAQAEATAAPPAPKPERKPIDWGARILKLIDGLLRYWWLILVVIAAIFVLRLVGPVMDWIDGPSGREVAADYRAEAAQNITRTTQAEAQRSAETVEIVERHTRSRDAVNVQVEEAREAIAQAPDFDARYGEYLTRAQRMRDESRAAAAAAVSEYRAGLDP